MKTWKKAMSLALSAALSLALAVPALAAPATDFEYLKFSKEPIGAIRIQDSMKDRIYLVVPDGTEISVPDGYCIGGLLEEGYRYDEYEGGYSFAMGDIYGAWLGYSDLTSLVIEAEDNNEGRTVDVCKVPDSEDDFIEEGLESVAVVAESFVKDNGISLLPEDQLLTSDLRMVNDWALEQVNQAVKLKLLPDTLSADLRANITREQFAGVAVRLYETLSGKAAEPAEENPFTDLSGWNRDTDSILKAYALGIAGGTSDTTFEPDALITREQMAAMLCRTYALLGVQVPEAEKTSFADDGSVSDWAKASVAFMAEKGFIGGVGDNTYEPQSTGSCEQALVIAMRMYNSTK